jgi:glycine oxidase
VETADVVIAGAGIIGLSLALDLASHGLNVTVLERGRAMSESSWAAAGMLAANDPENPPQLAELANLSLALYPGFLAQIEQLSGKKVPLRTKATIQAVTAGQAFESSKTRQFTRSDLQSIAPALALQYQHFLLIEEFSLDPRDLCAALPAAAVAAGVKIIEDSPALSIDAETTRTVVQTPTAAIAATHFANCTGAWAESPALGRPAPGRPRVGPVKGQITTVRLRAAILNHVLRTPEIYLVPRGDDRVTIGATVEHSGFDKTVSPHAIATLLKAAAEIFPPIADAEILESWAGLRPGSADELPLIGSTTNVGAPSCGSSAGWESQSHTWIATGHFRNGILLAPATARALSQLIRGESPAIDLAPFAPNRICAAIDRPLDRPVLAPSDNRSTAAL